MERLVKIVLIAVLLCFLSGTAFADFQIEGSTSGTFYAGSTPLGNSLFGLQFTGSSFGPTSLGPPSGTTLNLGTFDFATLLAFFNPFDFQLAVNFTAPAGAGGTTFSADLKGFVTLFGGSAKVDFANNGPIHFDFAGGAGSFDLEITDVVIPNFSSGSIIGTISNATYNPSAVISSVSVPEPLTPTVLVFNLLAVGLFAMVVRPRVS